MNPIVDVAPNRINNPYNVLVKCSQCPKAWVYYHVPPLSRYATDVNCDDEERADERF
jgi:chromodomain-helicase-DNA-binding protein 4